jgi:hypothetical protein
MTRQQFIEEIKQLSVAERIALIETIMRSLREDLEAGQDAASSSTSDIVRVAGESEREHKIAAVGRLRGIAKFEGEPPSDEESQEDYVTYLTEKYS